MTILNGREGVAIERTCFYITLANMSIVGVREAVAVPARLAQCIAIGEDVCAVNVTRTCWQKIELKRFRHW